MYSKFWLQRQSKKKVSLHVADRVCGFGLVHKNHFALPPLFSVQLDFDPRYPDKDEISKSLS